MTSIDDLYITYGKSSIVPISSIAQVRYYSEHNVQPVLVYPSEKEENKLTFWYLKDDTRSLYVQYRKYISDKLKENHVH